MPRVLSPDGVRLTCDMTGSGPPLLLLHGSGLSRAIWRGLGYVKPLAERFTVIRMDLRGHGGSGTPHDPAAYAPDRLVADVLTVLDSYDAPSADVVGYSLGARIGLHLALAAPDRVRHLVSLGGSASEQAGQVDRLFFPGTIATLRAEGTGAFCDRQGLGPDITDPRNRATRQAFLRNDPLALAAVLEATDRTAEIGDRALAACRTPTLWLAGDRDHPRYEESQRAASLMPNASFLPLPGRTHGTTLSPSAPVLRAILPFLLS